MSKIDDLILIDIADYLNENGYEADLDNEMIHVEFNEAIITIEDNNIAISFNISCDNTETAIITKLVMEGNANYKNYKVEIYEPYLEVFDENDEYVEMLFGNEIGDYMEDLSKKIINN